MGYAAVLIGARHKRVDAGCGRSYFVLMESDEKKGDRWLRLGELAPHEVIVVRCLDGSHAVGHHDLFDHLCRRGRRVA